MPPRLIYSTAAVRDLEDAIAWLTQPGSGSRAQERLLAILDAIDGLPESSARYRRDPDHPNFRLASVDGYVVQFGIGVGDTVFIARIFAPGQLR